MAQRRNLVDTEERTRSLAAKVGKCARTRDGVWDWEMCVLLKVPEGWESASQQNSWVREEATTKVANWHSRLLGSE